MQDYRPRRMNTNFPITLITDDGDRKVIMRDITMDGARIETDEPILAGEAVSVTIGAATLPALIQWSRRGNAGLRFMERPDPQMIDLIPSED